MDFPIFEMPFLGGRWLIGLVAILHVVINHSAAIGGSLIVVLLERKGHRTGDARWEVFAYRLAFAFFLLTTTLGALSGVGIWFATMVSQPVAIGSLLRIFFWAWFAEWLVFVGELLLVMAYFLSWRHFRRKETHLRLGWAYVAFSFATMAIVTAILGAMLTPGRYFSEPNFWVGFFNPTYMPQLTLRSGLALGLAAALALWASRHWAPESLRDEASRYLGRLFLVAMPLAAVGGVWYLAVLPEAVKGLIPVSMVTTRFTPYVSASYMAVALVAIGVFAVGAWSQARRSALPRWAAIAPFLALVLLLGQFERVREFVRKPYVIPGYMYSNGIRVDQVETLNRTGVLAASRYAAVKAVTPENRLLAGREVYKLECASCHTIGGLNDLGGKLNGAEAAAIATFIAHQHEVHPFMPPFVGTAAEREALAAYLASLARGRNPGAAPSPSARPEIAGAGQRPAPGASVR